MNKNIQRGRAMHTITSTTSRSHASAGNENALREQPSVGPSAAPTWQVDSHGTPLARHPRPQGETNTLPPRHRLGTMPPALLNTLNSHVASPSDRVHVALANTPMFSASTPAASAPALAHLQEAARSAKDFDSFMATLNGATRLPEAPRAQLLRELAGRVGDIAQWATSSQAHIQAAAPLAEQSFRELWRGVAALPASMQVEPLLVLGHQLGALSAENRLAAMQAILAATRPAAATPQRAHLLEHIASQLGLFLPQDQGHAVNHMLQEAATLVAEQRRSVVDALRSGLSSTALPADQHAAFLQATDKVSPNTPAARPSGRDLLGLKRQTR
ncbi:MAG TPA: hypothetical protein VFY35_10885 [Burkholderiaceae bacterium]|nr:hypothetical protein [Burkholderiaceae bacterium]